MALADMGFTTLSIQMPVLAADAQARDYYPRLFPEAAQRIHSLGSWMSEHYLRSGGTAYAAWICMGRGGEIAPVALPVLDVYGEKDNSAVLSSAAARRTVLERLPRSSQRVIAGGDHFYTGKEEELARVLRAFIEDS